MLKDGVGEAQYPTIKQRLTYEQARVAARHYYEQGRLLAQQSPDVAECRYRKGLYCCAIGAALTRDTLDFLTEQGQLSQKLGALLSYIDVPLEDYEDLRNLQETHDLWCRAVANRSGDAICKEVAFCRLIGVDLGP